MKAMAVIGGLAIAGAAALAISKMAKANETDETDGALNMEGKIINTDGEPVAGKVFYMDKQITATGDGRFTLKDVPPVSPFSIEVQASSYMPKIITVDNISQYRSIVIRLDVGDTAPEELDHTLHSIRVTRTDPDYADWDYIENGSPTTHRTNWVSVPITVHNWLENALISQAEYDSVREQWNAQSGEDYAWQDLVD